MLAACEKPGPQPPPPPVPETPTVVECGAGGERFADYRFVPREVRAAARIDLNHDDLSASLAALSEAARGSGHGLPIDLAFSLGQWSWQVPLVQATLQRGGQRPAELVFMHLGPGVSAWAWPSACDLEAQTKAADAGWSVAVKPAAFGAVARAPLAADGSPAFPYDVIYYRGAFVAFAAAGKSSAVAAALAAPVASDLPDPGDLLAAADAPIHLVGRGRSLVDPGSAAEGNPLWQRQATPSGLAPPP